jgi:hypothetical protein
MSSKSRISTFLNADNYLDEFFFRFTFVLIPGLGAKSNKKSSLLYVASTFTHQYVSFHTQQAGLVQFVGKRSNSVNT